MTEKSVGNHDTERQHRDHAADFEGVDAAPLQAELQETKERLMRTASELENFRRRTRRELHEQRQYAAVPVIQDLLPVVDNMRRAVESAEQSADFESLKVGVRMVLNQLDQVLKAHGLTEIGEVGQPFDPHFHEASSQQSSDEHAVGTVAHLIQTGYKLHDRVVRPAKVVVSGGPAEQEVIDE